MEYLISPSSPRGTRDEGKRVGALATGRWPEGAGRGRAGTSLLALLALALPVRADDTELHELLAAIEDPEAKAVATAERALLDALDGSCRTPIGGHARLSPDGVLHLTGLVARADGSFLLRREAKGAAADAERVGAALGAELRAECPRDIFA